VKFSARRVGWFLLLALAFATRLALFVERRDDPPAWDERFNLANLARMHQRGAYEPANYWYGGLSYLPQAALLEAIEWARGTFAATAIPAMYVAAPDEPNGGQVSAAGFRVCLALQLAYGIASLVVMGRWARRFAGARGGLLAAALLAAVPQHLHASVTFKPDILLLLTTLWTLERTTAAITRPGWRRFLAAGCGVGLTTATKLNGAVVAAPLVVFVVWNAIAATTAVTAGKRRDDASRRRELARARSIVAWSVLAAATALAIFVLVDRHIERHLAWARRNVGHYELRARQEGELQASSPLRMVTLLADGAYFGPLGAAVGGAATAWWLARAARGVRTRWRTRRKVLAVTAFPVAFLAQFVATGHAKANHLLEVAPFVLLATVALGGALARPAPAVVRRRLYGGALILACGLQLAVTASLEENRRGRRASDPSGAERKPGRSDRPARPGARRGTPAVPVPPAGPAGS
jgi:4-amino-4-deoxy-L-arabinose transferase-like glycosyltransferase